MPHLLFCLFIVSACFLFSACQGYDVKVNDKVVYAPKPLFRDFTVPDPGLNGCLEQAINDGVITGAQQLTTLDCSFAGIENLEGLSTFTGLTVLRLSANQVRNLVELATLSRLEALYLDDNKVVDPVPLGQLPSLRHLDLSGNPKLQCPRPGSLAQVTTVILPKHCQ
ncbi:MAG: leucine-rich repeat domain-containing protein [Halioglobus sp.]|nr:leucine-rich repeat domain-containing protein [Halioglobus sp.]